MILLRCIYIYILFLVPRARSNMQKLYFVLLCRRRSASVSCEGQRQVVLCILPILFCSPAACLSFVHFSDRTPSSPVEIPPPRESVEIVPSPRCPIVASLPLSYFCAPFLWISFFAEVDMMETTGPFLLLALLLAQVLFSFENGSFSFTSFGFSKLHLSSE